MAVSEDRKYTKQYVINLLENVKGKTLGDVDSSHQLSRTINSPKITGIAGDIIEQSVFGYEKDNKQDCDIEVDGILTELKTTGVRVPKRELAKASGKTGVEYNIHLGAKEGVTITNVTLDPSHQNDFLTSHFWEKTQHILFVFYEYLSYISVPASQYANFPIVDYCFNEFSEGDIRKLKSDWDLVQNFLKSIYDRYTNQDDRYAHMVGFTHALRPQLLYTELVPSFKYSKVNDETKLQKPRYRLKKTFVDYLVRTHFNKQKTIFENSLKESFDSYSELDKRCHQLTEKYKGTTLEQFHNIYHVKGDITNKNYAEKCILFMFESSAKKLNSIADFEKAGIIAKTITVTKDWKRTEDMKLDHIDFEEWNSKNTDFEESDVYKYFCEHSFLCPIFCERGNTSRKKVSNELKIQEDERISNEIGKTTFEGFKRFSFDNSFIYEEVKRTWEDSRNLVFTNQLIWEYNIDKENGEMRKNKSGSFKGAPNFPKSSQYIIFFRGGKSDSSKKNRTEEINGIKMLPQYFWIKGAFVVEKLKEISYL